jgi:hypothetical protein
MELKQRLAEKEVELKATEVRLEVAGAIGQLIPGPALKKRPHGGRLERSGGRAARRKQGNGRGSISNRFIQSGETSLKHHKVRISREVTKPDRQPKHPDVEAIAGGSRREASFERQWARRSREWNARRHAARFSCSCSPTLPNPSKRLMQRCRKDTACSKLRRKFTLPTP